MGCRSTTSPAPRAAADTGKMRFDTWAWARDLAGEDSDFDPIRDEPSFRQLISD
jgi:hypothetical protein